MTTHISPLAGKPAPLSSLIDVAKLVTAYFELRPDPAIAAQRVVFGTSGHRGSAFDGSFNEWHVLAITQAICDYRRAHDISGPLFIGIDTHALSEPRLRQRARSARRERRERHAGGERRIHADAGDLACHPDLQPRAQRRACADGIVITPSHNPPDNGGYKYNPPNGGPADTTSRTGSKRAPTAIWRRSSRGEADAATPTALQRRDDAPPRLSRRLRRRSRLGDRHGRDPRRRDAHGRRSAGRRRRPLLGGDRRTLQTGSHRGQRGRGSDVPLHDARLGRTDPHGPVLAVRDAALDRIKDRFDIAFACDTDHDRHGIVTPGRTAAPQPLPVGGDRLPVPAPPAVGSRGRRRQDRGQHRA